MDYEVRYTEAGIDHAVAVDQGKLADYISDLMKRDVSNVSYRPILES